MLRIVSVSSLFYYQLVRSVVKMSDPTDSSPIPGATSVPAVHLTDSLEDFQSDEQRLVLDTVAQIRKSGLEAVLPLPQIAVCGNQSSGKSSVLEALTEVPFPRSDNLCTRFATEIALRRGPVDFLRLSIIPDENRNASEKATITAFSETIADFTELPTITSKAATVIGIGSGVSDAPLISPTRAFAKDACYIDSSMQCCRRDVPCWRARLRISNCWLLPWKWWLSVRKPDEEHCLSRNPTPLGVTLSSTCSTWGKSELVVKSISTMLVTLAAAALCILA